MIDPKRIWASDQLPTLPAVAVRLIELSRNPEAELMEFVRVIQTDPAIAARILKAANSSFFGLASKVRSVDRAVMLLGTKAVIALALGFSLVDLSSVSGSLGEAYTNFWLQSAVQATAAGTLVEQLALAGADDTLLAGLLLDLGRLVLLRTIPNEYVAVIEAANTVHRPLHDLEHELLGINHVEVGAELARRWKLPQTLESAISLHHAAPKALSRSATGSDDDLALVCAVAAAVGDYFCGPSKGFSLERLRQLTGQFWSFSSSRLDAFLGGLGARIEQTADLFSISTQSLAAPGELLSQANEQLALLAMSAHAESTQARAQQEAIETEVRALEARNEQLQKQALRDALTSVYNRQFFDDTLDREVARCAREAATLGVVFFDVDHFKRLNDTLGHACGDEVLRKIASAADNTVRGSDVLARYGGEEFVILVHQPTENGIERLAERVRQRIEAESLDFNGTPLNVTVSVGAALCIPGADEKSAGSRLVQAADEAMYVAKQSGRNRVEIRVLLSDFDRRLMRAVTHRRFSRWLVDRGVIDVTAASRAILRGSKERIRLGEMAVALGILRTGDVDAILAEQQRTGRRFGEAAVYSGLLAVEQLVTLLALQHEDPRELAGNLERMKLIAPERIETLVAEYEAELGLPRRGPIAASRHDGITVPRIAATASARSAG